MSATYCPGAISFSPEESAVNSHAMCTWDSSRPTFQPLIASILFLNLCSSLSPGLLQVQNTTCSHVPAEATLRGAAGRSVIHATLTHLNVSFKEKKKKKLFFNFTEPSSSCLQCQPMAGRQPQQHPSTGTKLQEQLRWMEGTDALPVLPASRLLCCCKVSQALC